MRFVVVITLLSSQGAAAQTPPDDLFKAAAEHLVAKRHVQAAQAYDDLVANHPRSERVFESLMFAARIWDALGDSAKALARYRTLLKRFPQSDMAPQLAMHVGRLLPTKAARAHYKTALERYKAVPKVAVEAATRLAMLSRPKARPKLLSRAISADPNGEFAGEAALELARLEAAKFRAVTLPPVKNARRLGKALVRKAEALQKAEQLFSLVTSYRNRKWSVCAAVGTATLYADFADAIENVPTPKNLDAHGGEVYRKTLSDMTQPVRQKGVAALTQAVRAGWQSNQLGGCLVDAITRLEKIDPTALPTAPARDRLSARLKGKTSDVPLGIVRMEQMQRAILRPKTAEGYLQAAVRLLAEDLIAEAAVELKHALDVEPKNGRARLLLGLIHHMRRDSRGALAHFTEAAKDERLPHEDLEAIKARLDTIRSLLKR